MAGAASIDRNEEMTSLSPYVLYWQVSALVPNSLAVGNAIGCVRLSVCLSVCLPLCLLNLGTSFVACVWAMTIAHWRLKVKVIGQGQCKNVSATRVSTAASLRVLTDRRNNRFSLSRHQQRASAARRAAWHGRGQPRGRMQRMWCGRGNAVGLTLILDRGQFF